MLQNKVVVITGASSGIGKALAIEAYNRGAYIAVCARRSNVLAEQFGHLQQDRVVCVATDVTVEADCKKFIDTVLQKWGKIDVLINNAGISMRAMFEDIDTKVIRELMDVNFFGMVYCTRYALASIIENQGTVAAVSSIAGYRGLPARTGYSASKFAMQGFLESLRVEMLYRNVNVMWICPGFTASNIRNVARSSDGSQQGETPLDEQSLMTAEDCARISLDAIEKRKRTVVMTLVGKATVILNRFLPGLMDKQVYRHFANEPNSPLKRH